MKPSAWIALLLAFTSCSFQNRAHRINVDFNNTIEGITNELTLLNILRAKEGMPLHYTSVQRLTGSLTLRASAGFNAQIRADVPTDRLDATTTVAPTGATTLTNLAQRMVVSGGHLYVPSIGTEVNTGPSFDVRILDSKAFYQGILTSVPVPIVSSFLLQGFDSKRLMSLLVARIELRLKAETPGYSKRKGDLLETIRNDGGDSTHNAFKTFLKCIDFTGATRKPPGTRLAPMSRVTDAREGRSLSLQELAFLDGSKLDLSKPISTNPSDDSTITVTRPAKQQHVIQIFPREPQCPHDPEHRFPGKSVDLAREPPNEPLDVETSQVEGTSQVRVTADDGSAIYVEADVSVIFRSTEGVIQFIGRCLRSAQAEAKRLVCTVGDEVLFALHKGSAPDALISSSVLGERYYVAWGDFRQETMEAIALIERLINLQKTVTDQPGTVPVQVVP